jgi:hypothetical protein
MLARATFDQYAGADFALAHRRSIRALGRLPYRALHRGVAALAWLETWLRWPLLTLRALDGVDRTFSLLDPDGTRLGLDDRVRRAFRRDILYSHIPDLVVLLTSLDRRRFRREALVVEGGDTLARELATGRGVIVAGFRTGAHPVFPWALAGLGPRVSMIVGYPQLVRLGERLGETFLPRLTRKVQFVNAQDPQVLARSLDTLNNGGLVATLLELSPLTFQKTTPVRFLDWEINVPYGLSYLSAATGRSIVPALITREDGPRFRLRFCDPLPAPGRDRASILANTQQLYDVLAQKVLEFPEQWIGWLLLGSHMGIDLGPETPHGVPALS